jgi:hypothetical protein
MLNQSFTLGADIDEDELYSMYVDLIARNREAIESRTVPGSLREELLKDYCRLPWEHFEARLQSLKNSPGRYQAAVAALRRGFVEHH